MHLSKTQNYTLKKGNFTKLKEEEEKKTTGAYNNIKWLQKHYSMQEQHNIALRDTCLADITKMQGKKANSI